MTQDFFLDFHELVASALPGYGGRPCAFVRYGDGEAAIIAGRPYRTKADGWTYPGGYEEISKQLCNSLCCSIPGYFIGLPSPTYEPKHLAELMPFVRVPYDRITWAKIFIDTNYKHLRGLIPQLIEHCIVVSSSPTTAYTVPANGVMPYWGDVHIDRLVRQLMKETRPILVSAGPLANVIIHRYWSMQPEANRQTILDIGSAIDLAIKGYTVRVYSKLQHQRKDWAPYIGGVVDV